jgi:membrane associated rhomboid family serine protease
MIPLKDNIPTQHRPFLVYVIIGLNLLVFIFQMGMGREELQVFFHLFGVVPARFAHPEWAEWVGFPGGGYYTFITHMFLHAGWIHLLGNMWILWVFADNVEDIMGPLRFLFFYLIGGFFALGTHFIFNLESTMPVVGASGAIAGVMGAYLILYPHARVVTLIPIFFIPYIVELPAVVFLGIWFFIQLFSGLMAHLAPQAGGIAWWAHAGGFVGGIILLPLFKIDERCRDCFEYFRR